MRASPRLRVALSALLPASAALLIGTTPAGAQSNASIQRQLDELKRVIAEQQATIEALQRQVQSVEGQQVITRAETDEAAAKADSAVAALEKPPAVSSGQRLVKLGISGQINRIVNFAADGKNDKFYFLDNNNSVSRLIAKGEAALTDDLTATANIELGLAPNRSDRVSQDDEALSSDNGLDFRKVEGIFASKTYGSLYLGKGDPSTKDIARTDLSGTDVVAYAAVQDIAGGLFITDSEINRYSDTTIGDAFTDLDPSRQNRIRYDTPAFYGAIASVTGAENQRWNTAVKWAGKFGDVQGQAGMGFSDPNASTDDLGKRHYDVAGSGSVLHVPTGLNVTVGAGYENAEEANANFVYTKLGWKAALTEVGSTNFAVDYQQTTNRPTSADEAQSVGVVAVQQLRDYGMEVYGGFRLYSLDRSGSAEDFDTVYVGTVGTRIKF